MKVLCQIIGGSHLYGLNTPTSDKDYRYIFINDQLEDVTGLDKFEVTCQKIGDNDSAGFEVRKYLHLLRKTNSQVLEIIHAPKESFTYLLPEFNELVIKNKHKLCDLDKYYTSVKAYIHSEKKLATGERTGTLGRRKEQIDLYGYSPKNFVQLIRLAFCGRVMMESGGYIYPVVVKQHNQKLAELLLDIKTNPQNHNKEDLLKIVEEYDANVDKAYERAQRFKSSWVKYDHVLANRILITLYYPIVKELYDKNRLNTP